jgi:hypothetical protein
MFLKKLKVNNYKMGKIADIMAKRFGKIPPGEEEKYYFKLYTMESNLFKTYRKHQKGKKYDSRRVVEAINLFLLIIDNYLNDIEYDFSGQLNEGNKAYLNALQMSCDPFYNKELMLALKDNYDFSDKETLREFFADSVMCVIRIKDSVELWNKEFGINGYFRFIENQFGKHVKGNKLDYLVNVDLDKMNIDLDKL